MKKRCFVSKLTNEAVGFIETETDSTSNVLKVNPALVEVSDFDCVLCYRTLWKPVVTPCGHTYCLVTFC